MQEKSTRRTVLVSMPDQFLKSIDTLAKEEDRTRSELVREALRYYITINYGKETLYGTQTTQVQL